MPATHAQDEKVNAIYEVTLVCRTVEMTLQIKARSRRNAALDAEFIVRQQTGDRYLAIAARRVSTLH